MRRLPLAADPPSGTPYPKWGERASPPASFGEAGGGLPPSSGQPTRVDRPIKATVDSTLRALVCLLWLWGGGAALAAPAPRAQAVTTKDVLIQADRIVYDDKKQMVRLLGSVTFTQGETVLSAPYAEYNTKTQIGNLTGGVKVTQPGTVMTARKMTMSYKTKIAVLLGGVTIVTKKKFTPKETTLKEKLGKGDTTLTCQQLVYNWGTRVAVATGGVMVVQEAQRAFADLGEYYQDEQLVLMKGHVRVERGTDWMTCEEARLDLKEEIFVAVGNVTGSVTMKEETAPKTAGLEAADHVMEAAGQSRPADPLRKVMWEAVRADSLPAQPAAGPAPSPSTTP